MLQQALHNARTGALFGGMHQRVRQHTGFTQQPRSASVAAETDVDLLVVRGDTLSDAVGLNSWVGAFVRALANRLVAATKG